MHDVLRQRLIRKIESLPDAQIYQILDYIEFLESKYAETGSIEASGLQRFAEGLEDKLRRKAVSPSTIREAFQLISAADRVLSGVSSAGRQILSDLSDVLEPEDPAARGGVQAEEIEADPRKARPPARSAAGARAATGQAGDGAGRAQEADDAPGGEGADAAPRADESPTDPPSEGGATGG